MSGRKLILVVVDALKTEMLERAVAEGVAPNFADLLERGVFVRDCVSTFPSVTPVASATIVTGTDPDRHRIPAINWFHRGEHRYVEYGSSLPATRAFGLIRTLYDTVYNMNLAHLSQATPTLFERLGDAGLRTACTPYLIYRGRTRHEMSLEGVMRRVAEAAKFRHAVYGPDELFYGELYTSRKVPCTPTLARPGTRDAYSACVGVELVQQDLYDFLLLSLPDNDHHAHNFGPAATVASIAHADRSFGQVVEAAGGMDELLDGHAVILMADHSQTSVEWSLPLTEALADEWRVLRPSDDDPSVAEIAACPSARAGAIYLLQDEARRPRAHRKAVKKLTELRGVDLVAGLVTGTGDPPARPLRGDGAAADLEAAVWSRAGQLRFRPGTQLTDRRGGKWDVEGDLEVLAATGDDGRFESRDYPDALGRLWSALLSPYAGDLLVSVELGYECVDWGGESHVGGGSHGSLHRGDSLAPLLFVGCGPATAEERDQWALSDVAEPILRHFGLSPNPVP